jgi:hypothetical protein
MPPARHDVAVSSAPPPKVRPSGFLYLLPLLLLLAGSVAAIIAVVAGVRSYSDTIEGFARVPVGQSGTVQIDGTGGYTIFYEPGASDTSSFDESDPHPPLQITGPGGEQITLRDYRGLGTYSSSGYVGFAVETFKVERTGDYQVQTGSTMPGTIAIGRSPFHKITRGVLAGVALGFGGFVVALIILIILMVSRGRSKRRIRAMAPQPAWAAQPAWTPQPTPGYQQYPPSQPPSPPPSQPPYQPSEGFGPPPAAPGPPSAPPGPPPAGPDDTTTGWGQPQQ